MDFLTFFICPFIAQKLMQLNTKFCSPDEFTALMEEVRSLLELKQLTAIKAVDGQVFT